MGYFGEKTIITKLGTPVVLRDADPADASKLIAYLDVMTLDGQGQILEYQEFVPTVQEEQTWIYNTRLNPNEIVLVAFAGEQLIGVLDFKQEKRVRLGHCGHFGMGVLPAWRNQGLGQKLIENLLDWLRSYSSIEIVQLSVLASNTRALALYKNCGFMIEGRRCRSVKFNSESYDDEILMAQIL